MKAKLVLLGTVFLSTISVRPAQAQVCGELFRSTPQLESALESVLVATSASPSLVTQTNLFRAAERDVLNLSGFSDRALQSLQESLHFVPMERQRLNQATVEFHRRRYERLAREHGLDPHADLSYRLGRSKNYLNVLVSLAANGTANYLALRYLGTAGVLVHLPNVRLFDFREIPNDVLHELLTTRESARVPKTEAFVKAKIAFGADLVVSAIRRAFNYGMLVVILVAHGDLITDPNRATARELDQAALALRNSAIEQNEATLKLLREKRAVFVREGNSAKIAEADRLITENENQNQILRNRKPKN